MYVDDLCWAVLLALESTVSGEVFQIAMGVETSIQELASMVQEVTGGSVEVRHGPTRRGDIRKNYFMMNKVRTALGWEPRVALREDLELTWDWCRRWEGK